MLCAKDCGCLTITVHHRLTVGSSGSGSRVSLDSFHPGTQRLMRKLLATITLLNTEQKIGRLLCQIRCLKKHKIFLSRSICFLFYSCNVCYGTSYESTQSTFLMRTNPPKDNKVIPEIQSLTYIPILHVRLNPDSTVTNTYHSNHPPTTPHPSPTALTNPISPTSPMPRTSNYATPSCPALPPLTTPLPCPRDSCTATLVHAVIITLDVVNTYVLVSARRRWG